MRRLVVDEYLKLPPEVLGSPRSRPLSEFPHPDAISSHAVSYAAERDLKLRTLLERDRQRRTEDPDSAWRSHVRPSPAQRAAVSAHWSAELRAKVKASAERERNRVVVDLEEP